MIEYYVPPTTLANFLIFDQGKVVFATNFESVFQTEIRNPIYAGGSAVAFVYQLVNLTFNNTETVINYNFYRTANISGTFAGSTKNINFYAQANLTCNTGNISGNYTFFDTANIIVSASGGLALNSCNFKFLSNFTIDLDITTNQISNCIISCLAGSSLGVILVRSNLTLTGGTYENVTFRTSNNATLANISGSYQFKNCFFDFRTNAASASAYLTLRANNTQNSIMNCAMFANNQNNAVINISLGSASNKLNVLGLSIVKPTPATIFTGTLFFRAANVEAVAP